MPTDPASFWRNRPTLVTGGTGLLGSWMVRQLLAAGAKVVCLVREPSPEALSSTLLSRTEVVRGDIRDLTAVQRAMHDFEIATVVHLAGQAIVSKATRDPVSAFEANIQGTWVLLEACRHSPSVRQVLLASSDGVYGEWKQLPCTEDGPLLGRNPYGVSKVCAELIAQSYATTYQLPVVIARCGNFFGGGDLNFNRIVPGTIRSLYNNEAPVIRSDGRYVRDYLYIEDGVAAYMRLAECLAERPELAGQVFNFSNGSPISVIDMVRLILRVAGSKLEPRILSEVSNEVREQYASNEKAQKILEWSPRFSLEEGLRRTIDWYHQLFAAEAARERTP